MERGSTKHGAMRDDALVEELSGELGPGGSNREDWAAAEPPADDDPESRVDRPAPTPADDGQAGQDDEEPGPRLPGRSS